VFGDIEIGDNCIIGAGSIVKTSFKTNSIIAGNPAKLISKKTI
jgi:serine acetyltransferase